jgi:hypothetical protein
LAVLKPVSKFFNIFSFSGLVIAIKKCGKAANFVWAGLIL